LSHEDDVEEEGDRVLSVFLSFLPFLLKKIKRRLASSVPPSILSPFLPFFLPSYPHEDLQSKECKFCVNIMFTLRERIDRLNRENRPYENNTSTRVEKASNITRASDLTSSVERRSLCSSQRTFLFLRNKNRRTRLE
jgi:hypothetical protein